MNIIRIDNCGYGFVIVQNNIILQIGSFVFLRGRLNWTSKDMSCRRMVFDIPRFSRAKSLINVFFAMASHLIDPEIDDIVGQASSQRQNGEKWKTKCGAYHLIFLVGPQHHGAFHRRFVLIHPLAFCSCAVSFPTKAGLNFISTEGKNKRKRESRRAGSRRNEEKS